MHDFKFRPRFAEKKTYVHTPSGTPTRKNNGTLSQSLNECHTTLTENIWSSAAGVGRCAGLYGGVPTPRTMDPGSRRGSHASEVRPDARWLTPHFKGPSVCTTGTKIATGHGRETGNGTQ